MTGIGQNVKFIGMGDTIEIWPNEEDDRPFMDTESFTQALEQIMNGVPGPAEPNEEQP